MDFRYELNGEVKVVRLERHGAAAQVTIADRVYEVRVIHSRAGEWTFTVDGVMHTAFSVQDRSTCFVAIEGDIFELEKPAEQRARRKHSHSEDNLAASMPGQVTKVLVSAGDRIQRGQPLIVLEAMKMEMKIAAPHDGRVVKVLVMPGQLVERGQGLVEMSQDV